MTGGLINFYEFKNKNTIDIALNVEFAVGGDYVDGFFIGGGFGLGRKLEFIFGYSLGRGTELSHGFQRAMGQFIKKHKGDRRYPEFKGIDLVDGVIADIRDYDGLPLSFVNHRGRNTEDLSRSTCYRQLQFKMELRHPDPAGHLEVNQGRCQG